MKSVSGKKLAQILESHGWKVSDTKGSHFKYKKNNQIVVLPIHSNKDLKIGTLKSIMKQAGLTEKDL